MKNVKKVSFVSAKNQQQKQLSNMDADNRWLKDQRLSVFLESFFFIKS